MEKKALWTTTNICWKIKNQSIIVKINYNFGPIKIDCLKINQGSGNSESGKQYMRIKNPLNIQQDIIIFPGKKSNTYYEVKNLSNNSLISLGNAIFTIAEGENGEVQFIKESLVQTKVKNKWEIPFISVLLAIHQRDPNKEFNEIHLDILEKQGIIEYEEHNNHKNHTMNEMKTEITEPRKDEQNIKFHEKHISELKDLESVKNGLMKDSKKVDLYPTVELSSLYNIDNTSPIIRKYMLMIIYFSYGNYKMFNKLYGEVFKSVNIFHTFTPLKIQEITELNEELFWYMMTLLPSGSIGKKNIILMTRYSFLFPSNLKDKIISYIIYNLFIHRQFAIINELVRRKLINKRINFNSDFILSYTSRFSGMGKGHTMQHPMDREQISYYVNSLKIEKKEDGNSNLPQLSVYLSILYSKWFPNMAVANLFINFMLWKEDKIIGLKKIDALLFLQKKYQILFTKEQNARLYNILIYHCEKNLDKVILLTKTISQNFYNNFISYLRLNEPAVYENIIKNDSFRLK